MRVRRAQSGDLAQIIELERRTPTAAHWSEEQYVTLLSQGASTRLSACFVAEDESSPGSIRGFLVARHLIAEEWEIENIVVSAPEQRKGVGSALLQEFLHTVHAGSVLLEVRESNLPARSLYKKHGFLESGKRKNYYSGPEEDAVLLTLSLKAGGTQS